MKKWIHAIYMELRRGVLSWRFPLAIVGIIGLLWLACLKYSENSVLMILSFLPGEGIGSMLIWGIAAVPYTSSLCEELENRYYIQKILRGNQRLYLSTKVVSVFLMAALTFFIGFALFVGLLCQTHPVIGADYEASIDAAYWSLTSQELYLPYMLLVDMQLACLAGCLSLVALAVSVYLPNRMLVLVTPVVFLYIEGTACYRLLRNNIGLVVSLQNTAYASIASQYGGATWYMGYIQMVLVAVISMVLVCCGLERRLNRG